MYVSMYSWFRDMSAGGLILDTFTAGFLWCFRPPCSYGLTGTYMWPYITESLVVSGKFRIINSHTYALKLGVTGQYKFCWNYRTFLAPSTS